MYREQSRLPLRLHILDKQIYFRYSFYSNYVDKATAREKKIPIFEKEYELSNGVGELVTHQR